MDHGFCVPENGQNTHLYSGHSDTEISLGTPCSVLTGIMLYQPARMHFHCQRLQHKPTITYNHDWSHRRL